MSRYDKNPLLIITNHLWDETSTSPLRLISILIFLHSFTQHQMAYNSFINMACYKP